jgi:hypothetical protein
MSTRAETHLCDLYDLARDVRDVGQGQVDWKQIMLSDEGQQRGEKDLLGFI